MYKIYINGTPLLLAATAEAAGKVADERNMMARYMGNSRLLLSYFDMLEKNPRFESVTIFADDVEKLFSDFAGQFRVIEAAGGVVYNRQDEVLLIHRRGYWDLPKGKIDDGESREAAAAREVMEETGLSAVEMGEYLGLTYHTYRDKKSRRILKATYWYRMRAEREALAPQREEDIEHAEWRGLKDFFGSRPRVYGNIRDLLARELEGA